MSNFIKKLTGALKMPEDDELFDDDTKSEAIEPQKKTSDPKDVPREEAMPNKEAQPQNPTTDEESTPDTSIESDTAPSYDTELEGDTTQDADEELPTDTDSEKKPYTIAQLAQATATKRAPRKVDSRAGGSALSRLAAFSKKKTKKQEEKPRPEPEGQLAIDVYETPTDIIIKSTIAGVNPEDLDIGIDENTVNIRGSRHNEEKIQGADYFYQECYWGTFSRSIILPVEIDADKAEATLKNGLLSIKLPKIIKEKEKKIKVVG